MGEVNSTTGEYPSVLQETMMREVPTEDCPQGMLALRIINGCNKIKVKIV